jgi:hypothetical protein
LSFSSARYFRQKNSLFCNTLLFRVAVPTVVEEVEAVVADTVVAVVIVVMEEGTAMEGVVMEEQADTVEEVVIVDGLPHVVPPHPITAVVVVAGTEGTIARVQDPTHLVSISHNIQIRTHTRYFVKC